MCQSCNGSGRVPVLGAFSGKPIAGAFAYCDCPAGRNLREPMPDAHEPRPEDFDFPCSYDWRRFYTVESGGRDTGPLAPRPVDVPADVADLRQWVADHKLIHRADPAKRDAEVERTRQRYINEAKD